jgi:hypothetical protein
VLGFWELGANKQTTALTWLGGFLLFFTKRKQGRRGRRFTYILITGCYILQIYIYIPVCWSDCEVQSGGDWVVVEETRKLNLT